MDEILQARVSGDQAPDELDELLSVEGGQTSWHVTGAFEDR